MCSLYPGGAQLCWLSGIFIIQLLGNRLSVYRHETNLSKPFTKIPLLWLILQNLTFLNLKYVFIFLGNLVLRYLYLISFDYKDCDK